MSIQNKYSIESKWDVPLMVSVEQLQADIEKIKSLDVSNESLFSAVTELFNKTFNTLRLTAQSLFSSDKVNSKNLMLDTARLNRLDKNKLSRNYAAMLDLEVDIPPGMAVDYETYIRQSFEVSKALKDVISQVAQLRIDIGRVISTDKGLTDSTLFSDMNYIRQADLINKELKTLSTMKKPNDFNAVAKYGDVFNSGIDIYAVVKLAEDNSDLINSIDRKKLLNEVDTAVQYVRDLTGMVSEGYSKPMIAKIANATTKIAEIVEAFSVCVYNAEIITVALNSAIAKAEDFLKGK